DGRLSGVYHKKDVSNNTTYTTSTDTLANTSDDLDLTNLSYTINNDGEITARSRGIYSPAGTLSRTVSMGAGYDNAGRLTSETYNGGGQYSISRTNAYDKANNRTSVVQGGVTSTYTNYPGNRLQSVAKSGVSTRFTYDTLGRMTCSWIDTDGDSVVDTNEVRTYYRWTYSGLLKEVETWKNVGGTLTQTIVRYTYDESGTGLLYIREVVGGTKTRFHWEGYDLYLEEVQSGTTWNSKYAYMNQPSAIGSTVARFDLGANYTLDSTDTYYFYHYDEAGNVILITDKNGNVVDHFEQDAWGNDLNNTFNTARSIAQHQTSKFYDTTTGLYFFGARWYYPEIGRFISVSPLSLIAEEDYAYCSSDPVNLVDLDGKIPIPLIIGAGYILFEWGLAVYDSYDTLATVIDPNQSFTAKTI
ncbi:MAG: hypothetical protein H3C48_20260, partial [Chitinophagaceae bacterium]|nr:hypothetical protein [Chitinophagaceae bacterium]